MQLEIKIDRAYPEPKVLILTAAMTEDVNRLLEKIANEPPQMLSGSKNKKIELIDPDDLLRVYANSGKVFAVTDKGEYTMRLRLYEMEERLNSGQFVRISNSEIINLKKVKNFDLRSTGTICVELANGTTTYVSRRYVAKLKTILGV